MIKTIMYNEIGSYSYEELKDEQFMFNAFKEFIENGGNLSLPVLGYDKKIVNFEKWFIDNIGNNALFTKLIDLKYIENPFSFIVDHNEKIVRDQKQYGLYWLKENYEKYNDLILKGIAQLAEQISDWEFKPPVKMTREERRAFFKLHEQLDDNLTQTSNMIYEHIDYNNQYAQEKNTHPLLFILERLKNSQILEIILKTSSKYHALWQSDSMIEDTIGTLYGRVDNVDKAYLLYKYNVNNNYFMKEENRYIMTSIFQHAIYTNDIDFIEKNLKVFKLSDIEQRESLEDLFIPKSQSKEMTHLLINNGAFVHGKIGKGTYEVNVIRSKTPTDSLEVILDYSEQLRNEVITKPENYYSLMTENNHNNWISLDSLKMLITKYHFPLEKFDMFYPVKNYWKNYPEIFSWLVENGANPKRCSKFISSCVNDRSDGLKILRNLQKSKKINFYEPDPILNILRSEPTKEFLNWIDKAPPEKFLEENIDGFPAWWGVSNISAMSLVLPKIKNISQNSSNGLSLFYFAARVGEKNRYNDFSFFKLLEIYKHKHPNQTINFDVSGTDKYGKNMFHYLFSYEKYRREDCYPDLINFMLEHTSSNMGAMICEKDNNGQTPLELMYYCLAASNNYSVITPVKKLLVTSLPHIDFDTTITMIENEEQFKMQDKSSLPRMNAYTALDRMMGQNEDFKRVLCKAYDRYNLNKKLHSHLEIKEEKNIKIKI